MIAEIAVIHDDIHIILVESSQSKFTACESGM